MCIHGGLGNDGQKARLHNLKAITNRFAETNTDAPKNCFNIGKLKFGMPNAINKTITRKQQRCNQLQDSAKAPPFTEMGRLFK
jgi:hypothetical protein